MSAVELVRNAAGEIIKRTFRGNAPWLNLDDHYPQLRPLYLEFERNYDPEAISVWMKTNMWVPIVSVTLYVILIAYGPIHMKDRSPYDWRQLLIYWNLFLSSFSFYGAFRTVPWLIHALHTISFEELVCLPPEKTFGPGSVGLASQLFVLSKIPELIDTLFIVVHKKPLQFLHWYHHITVLLFCWHSYVTESAYGIFFIAMNYSVHAIMYGYFALMAMKKIPKGYPSHYITTIQILQMFGGTFIVGYGIYYRFYGGSVFKVGECANIESNLVGGGIIYTTYLYLFVKFAYDKFLKAPAEKKDSKKEKKIE